MNSAQLRHWEPDLHFGALQVRLGMVQRRCEWCNEEIQASGDWDSLFYLPGKTGALYILNGEAPIHKCASLTVEEAAELLKLAGNMLDFPAFPDDLLS